MEETSSFLKNCADYRRLLQLMQVNFCCHCIEIVTFAKVFLVLIYHVTCSYDENVSEWPSCLSHKTDGSLTRCSLACSRNGSDMRLYIGTSLFRTPLGLQKVCSVLISEVSTVKGSTVLHLYGHIVHWSLFVRHIHDDKRELIYINIHAIWMRLMYL